jgi:hypothetical protein
MPISKARVVSAKGYPDQNGFHSVRIRVYGDESTYLAPVLMPMPGCVWIPDEGTDVAVMFNQADKPWVIGSWYALDRVEDDDVDLPDYEPGDLRLGNSTGSSVTVHHDGHISLITDDTERVDIDNQSAAVYLSTDYSASSNGYTKIPFDAVEEDREGLFRPATNDIQIHANGLHRITTSVEVPTPGQNNTYSLGIFVNGTIEKRISRQSSVNEQMSIQVTTEQRLETDDIVDVRFRNESGQARTVRGSQVTTDFSIRRAGI